MTAKMLLTLHDSLLKKLNTVTLVDASGTSLFVFMPLEFGGGERTIRLAWWNEGDTLGLPWPVRRVGSCMGLRWR
jgi:hypothetical protein